jgi:rRNA small subunit pseudouridine methyltransferase Nep1
MSRARGRARGVAVSRVASRRRRPSSAVRDARTRARAMEPPPPDDDANRKDGGYVFVLELATLETAKVGKGYAILNCDDHANFIRRHGKQPGDHRPDICHQALLAILDSPLNKAGMVKAIYVNTQKNVLFRVSPKTRVPRTFKRFCGLMVQLLQKLSVRSSNGPEKLMQVVKQPVTKYFPAGARRVGFSFSAPEVKKLPEYVKALPEDAAVVFTIGAMAHGKVDVVYTDDFISVSRYPLSAACCIGRICNALELKHDIV